MTDNNNDHMTVKYKVLITSGMSWIILQSGMKPQNASEVVRKMADSGLTAVTREEQVVIISWIIAF